MMSEVFEFEYNVLQEMLIVNHQEGFSYNMCYEGDVCSVTRKLNEQQATIKEQNKEIEESSVFIIEQRKENKTLKEENEQLKDILKRLYFKTDDKFVDNNDVLYLERLCNE